MDRCVYTRLRRIIPLKNKFLRGGWNSTYPRYFVFCFWDRILLWSFDWPGTCYVDIASLEFAGSTSWVLESLLWVTTPGSVSTLKGQDYFLETHLELTEWKRIGLIYHFVTFYRLSFKPNKSNPQRCRNQWFASLEFHPTGKLCKFLLSNLSVWMIFCF